jgi:hypothetical protein
VVSHWLTRYIAGIAGDPPGPGYRRSTIQPQAGGGLTQAGARSDALREWITSVGNPGIKQGATPAYRTFEHIVWAAERL